MVVVKILDFPPSKQQVGGSSPSGHTKKVIRILHIAHLTLGLERLVCFPPGKVCFPKPRQAFSNQMGK